MESRAFFTDTVGVMAVVSMVPVLFVWLERKTKWKVFNVLPAIIWIFLTPIALSNAPLIPSADGFMTVIPRSSPIYSTFKAFAVPMFIVLMLLDINIREALKVAWRGVFVLVIGSFGIVVGATMSYAVFSPYMEPETWRGFGALAGSWIGGTGNLAAVAESVDTPEEMVGMVVVVDNFVYLAYFPVILTCKRWAAKFNRFTRVSEAQIRHIAESTKGIERKSHTVHFRDLLTLIGIGFSSILVANWLSTLLPEIGRVVTQKTWAMLLVTTIGIILSATPLKNIAGSDSLSMALVYIYMTMIGAGANLAGLSTGYFFLIAGAVCIVVHFIFVIGSARLFRVDVSMAAVASVAAVGGAASAPVAAGYHREELVPVSIMLALIGYGLGNYLGVLTAIFCSWVG